MCGSLNTHGAGKNQQSETNFLRVTTLTAITLRLIMIRVREKNGQ